MNIDLRYLGRSELKKTGGGVSALSFSPNLARDKVFYDGELRYPLRFREAISALHDVVVGDHRFKKRDKSAYKQWKADEEMREAQLRRDVYDKTKRAEVERISREPLPPNLEDDFRRLHRQYWAARVQWANELSRNDPALFRALVPCDPVVTVAPDVVFFECFAKDESSYGCLLVDRDAFAYEGKSGLGTTNVDYSVGLYEHFQSLRTYRPTRLLVDPTGFEVKVEGHEDYREEKIELPPTWLRGFGQLQAAMGLPSRRVELSTDAVYSLLAYLKRHKEKSGPRSLRFVLQPGKRAKIVVDPFNVEIESHGAVYDGDVSEEIKVWGRRRLMVLARLLPIAERVEVALLGNGLPSVWIVHCGEMRFVLALSGWTTNDWSSGSALELLSGGFRVDGRVVEVLSQTLRERQRATLRELSSITGAAPEVLLGSLNLLSKQAQVIYDFSAEAYRWRQAMPVAVSEAMTGPDHPELVGAREAWKKGGVRITSDTYVDGKRLLMGTVNGTKCEALIDGDGYFKKATCTCSYFYKSRMRQGPCMHLLALKMQGSAPTAPRWFDKWFR